jgi:hypothetical protein
MFSSFIKVIAFIFWLVCSLLSLSLILWGFYCHGMDGEGYILIIILLSISSFPLIIPFVIFSGMLMHQISLMNWKSILWLNEYIRVSYHSNISLFCWQIALLLIWISSVACTYLQWGILLPWLWRKSVNLFRKLRARND